MKELNNELSRKLEAQTQRLELLTAQSMANESTPIRQPLSHDVPDSTPYADEGDEVLFFCLNSFFLGAQIHTIFSKTIEFSRFIFIFILNQWVATRLKCHMYTQIQADNGLLLQEKVKTKKM